jgi:hypothetical protein
MIVVLLAMNLYPDDRGVIPKVFDYNFVASLRRPLFSVTNKVLVGHRL